jgi:succinyl-CoA synthetase alpha subunit
MQAFRQPALSGLRLAARQRGYATASAEYTKTRPNLRITSETKVLFQGFTGKQGS